MTQPEPEEPQELRPYEGDPRLAVALLTAVWAVALVVLLVLHDRLADDGHSWWIWSCVVGVCLGLLGLRMPGVRRRR